MARHPVRYVLVLASAHRLVEVLGHGSAHQRSTVVLALRPSAQVFRSNGHIVVCMRAQIYAMRQSWLVYETNQSLVGLRDQSTC